MWTYKTDMTWQPGTKEVEISCGNRPPLKVQPPPEFGGDDKVWTPEDLMVAANQSCLLLTLLFWTKQKKVKMLKHDSHAEATMDRTKEGLRFTGSSYEVDVWIESEEDRAKMQEAFDLAMNACPVKAASNVPYTAKLNIHVEEPATF